MPDNVKSRFIEFAFTYLRDKNQILAFIRDTLRGVDINTQHVFSFRWVISLSRTYRNSLVALILECGQLHCPPHNQVAMTRALSTMQSPSFEK